MKLSEEEVIPLLERDVSRTLGERHAPLVRAAAKNVSEWESVDAGEKIVGDVQQIVHDTFVDPTWPPCPEHQNHPLWYKDGSWWCTRNNVEIAPLGQLQREGNEESR